MLLYLIISLFSFTVVPEKPDARFEGTMTFVKLTHYDTTYFAYHVKDDYIRIEEMTKTRELSRVYIVDTQNRAMVALHPKRKLFTTIHVTPYLYAQNPDIEVIRTSNRKRIRGVVCTQWRVRNQKENTEITYWVANDEFYFFRGLIEIIDGVDKINYYFMQIPEAEGFMPVLTEERSLLREKRTHIEMIEIERKILDPKLFTIPSDFKLFTK